ncbi:hypothetical protein HYR69_11495 [Candidatus Sumerlaeota bacterium]|nr:hypothetical protein [Candidatus Sumerlaeota bacterium]
MNQLDRRQTSWINPEFQGRFVRTMLMLQVVAMIAGGTIIGLGWCVFGYLPGVMEFHPIVYGVMFLIGAGAIGGGVLLYAIQTSHKICGPLHRVIQCLKSVQRQEHPGPIEFRYDDYFKELEEVVNDTIELLYDQEVSETFRRSEPSPEMRMVPPGAAQPHPTMWKAT